MHKKVSDTSSLNTNVMARWQRRHRPATDRNLPSSRSLPRKDFYYFLPSGSVSRPSRSCFSANKRLISVTSRNIFFGSCSTAACLQSSVQCSLSFISALMPPEFPQTLTLHVSDKAETAL